MKCDACCMWVDCVWIIFPSQTLALAGGTKYSLRCRGSDKEHLEESESLAFVQKRVLEAQKGSTASLG